METATIKSWPEWLHWCSVSIKTEGKWPERGSRVATYWLNKLPAKYGQLLYSGKGWFIIGATWTWIKYKEFISEREKSKQNGTVN